MVCAVTLAGLFAEVFFSSHYAAPIACVVYAIVLQGMRHLRVWRWQGRRVGLLLVRMIPPLCSAGVLVTLCGVLLRKPDAGVWPTIRLPPRQGTRRPRILAQLEREPGHQLAIVRYSPDHDSRDEWVSNGADIDGEKVVWARDMGGAQDEELIKYFKGRVVWLVEPDSQPPKVSLYSASAAD